MTQGKHSAPRADDAPASVRAVRPLGKLVRILVAAAVLLPALALAYLSTAPSTDRTWFWQNQVPQGNDLRAMSWAGTSTVWAVGVAGTALKSTDGGKTFSVMDLGSTTDFTGVSFAPTSTTGWAVGLSGTIKKTPDGGTTWASQTSPLIANMRAVSAWSTTVAVAVGDAGGTTSTIVYTADGTTWRSAGCTSTVGLTSVEMVSATTGWAVGGNGVLLKTVNGGASWTVQPTTTTAGLQSIAFAPGGVVGYFVGNAALPNWTVYKTANSGATWTAVSGLGVTGAVNLFGVDVLDANNAITVGANGAIRRTADGGTTWGNESQNNNGQTALRAVKLFDTANAYTIGDVGSMYYTRASGTAFPSWFNLGTGAQAQLNAVDFFDANNGWAVGVNGAIMHTTDAGQTWEKQGGGINSWLAVASVSATQAWAVGQNGWIARTVNGSDWTTQTSGTSQQLNGVWFTSATNGVAVGNGGVILQTTNGGTTWTARASGTTQNLNAVWFAANGTLGYAVGNAGTMKGTTNGGSSWSTRTFANTTANLLAVTGDSANNNTLNQSHLWVGGSSGAIQYTAAGGQNAAGWTDLAPSAGVTATANVRTVSAISTSTVWITADYGFIRRTANGTVASPTWTTQTANVPLSTSDPLTHIWGASFVSATQGWIVGDSGVVCRTLDTGTTWTSLQYGTLGNLNDITFTDTSNGWAVGAAGTVMRTSDGGQTWVQQRAGTTSGFWGVSMVTSTTGWAVGDNGTVRRTVNGGLQWTGQNATTNTVNLSSVGAGDTSHAVIAGQGIVRWTADAGSTWTSASVPPTQPVTGVSMIGTGSVWAVSTRVAGNNVVWHSTDGGATWASQATTANANLWDVSFRDLNNGWAAGDNGTILKTVNGGATWTKMNSPTSLALNVIRFMDASNGWVAGANGVVASTNDGGTTWKLRQSGTGLTLNGLAYAGTLRGFLVGVNAVLLRNDNGTPPTSSVSVAPPTPSGANGWYGPTAPTIALASSATTPTIYYGWTSSAGPWTTYASPFPAIEGNQTLYFYSVDGNGLGSAVSTKAIKSDLTSPTAPPSTGVSFIGTSSVTVTWTAASDGVSGVDHYDLFVGGSFATSTSALTAQVTGLLPNTLYPTITVQAVDAAGLRSSMSTPPLSVLTHDTTTSPYVTVLTSSITTPNGANGWYVTTPTVTLSSVPVNAQLRTTYFSWNVSGSNVVGPPWTAYTVPLTPAAGANILYFWTHDDAGSRAPEIVRSQPFLLDTAVPATPSVTASATDYRSIVASWPAVPDPPSGIARYDVYLNGAFSSSVTTANVAITALAPLTSYSLNVRAVSSAGTTSALSATQTVTTPAPPRPFAPWAVYTKAPNGAQIYIDWTAADNVAGTVSYHVWRSPSSNPASMSVIATVTGGLQTCTYVDSGLASSTQYWYSVSTLDNRGESDLSTITAYTTAVTQRPQRVTDLSATGLTTSTVFLQWAPSGDPNLAGYEVFRADSSLASTATTLTALTASTAYFDFAVQENEPYYYTVKAIDKAGAQSFASVEILGTSLLSTPQGTFSPHEAGAVPNGCLCHASHTASGEDKLTRFPGSSSVTLCQGTCHTPDFSNAQFVDPLLKSKHPEGASVSSAEPFTCLTCHVPLYTAGQPMANLMRTNSSTPCTTVANTPPGNSFCYSCHGPGSTLTQGDMSYFENSGHATIPAPPTGANITCDACHASHSSRNDFLLRYEGWEDCIQCHTRSATNPNEIDIYDLLTANDGVNTAHPLLPEDQANGARMTCQNCHNPHSSSATYPLVDPHNPSPSGRWVNPVTDEIGFCERCHNGQPLPTSQETTPWAPPVLASNGVTTAYNMAAYYPANVHGFSSASGAATTTAYLRTDMGYKYGDVLQCYVCHEPHGATNSNGIKSDITSANGGKTISGVVTVKVTGGGKDFRFFCATCHVWNSATHDAIAGTSTVMFPMNCAACHTHALGAATAPLF